LVLQNELDLKLKLIKKDFEIAVNEFSPSIS